MIEEKYNGYDTNIVCDYKSYPDLNSGRCYNCDNAQFKSSVKSFTFIRKCCKIGMKKSIEPFKDSKDIHMDVLINFYCIDSIYFLIFFYYQVFF